MVLRLGVKGGHEVMGMGGHDGVTGMDVVEGMGEVESGVDPEA